METLLLGATYIFITIIIYFFLFLLYSNFQRVLKRETKKKLQKKLYSTLKDYKRGQSIPEEEYIWLKNNLGLEVVLEALALGRLNKKGEQNLKHMLKTANYKRYIVKLLKTKDKDLLAFNVKLIGELEMKFVTYNIIKILYNNQDNVYLQYNCLLTLSKFGNKTTLLKIFNDENIDINLTDSALKEVFCSYSGKHQALYKTFLKTTNPNILRLCIKLIGLKKYNTLSKDIIPFLDSNNFDIVVNTIRTLGILKEKSATPKIKSLFTYNHPTIKVECINALANINLTSATNILKQGLYDSDWWVRYNAAIALINHPKLKPIYHEVSKSGNIYAIDILNYAKQLKKLNSKGGANHDRTAINLNFIR